jgi:hypothetical protein
MRNGGDDGPLSPADADRLLKRASELDMTRNAATSIEQLRQAAIDAGIDASAFDAALRELRQEAAQVQQTARPASTSSHSLWTRISVLGLSLGAATELFRPFSRIDGLHTDRLGASALLLAAFAFLLLRHGHSGRHAGFQRDLAALFVSFGAGFWMAHGGVESAGPWVAMMGIAGGIWIGTAVLGAVLIAFMNRSAPRLEQPTEAHEAANPEAADDRGFERAEMRRVATIAAV